jgi:hypothetical protein
MKHAIPYSDSPKPIYDRTPSVYRVAHDLWMHRGERRAREFVATTLKVVLACAVVVGLWHVARSPLALHLLDKLGD